jgi:hypothetical protein
MYAMIQSIFRVDFAPQVAFMSFPFTACLSSSIGGTSHKTPSGSCEYWTLFSFIFRWLRDLVVKVWADLTAANIRSKKDMLLTDSYLLCLHPA